MSTKHLVTASYGHKGTKLAYTADGHMDYVTAVPSGLYSQTFSDYEAARAYYTAHYAAGAECSYTKLEC